ncbi:MAG: CDP-alcohol phosphatidyltransferase family protein, partial [Bacteroidota bacterium]
MQDKCFAYLRLVIKKNIPNLLTLCNLLCGCVAMVCAVEGNFIWSAYMVGIACVLDFLDGLVARALKVSSELGKQLDSLADIVSFGVVPGVMMCKMIYIGNVFNDHILPEIFHVNFLVSTGLLITIFSAIRLAKFNIDTRQNDSFIGLPTPANAVFIASLSLLGGFSLIYRIKKLETNVYDTPLSFDNAAVLQTIILNPYFLIFLTLISSFLLIAPLPLFALKFKNFS